jgi:hypothetical protein
MESRNDFKSNVEYLTPAENLEMMRGMARDLGKVARSAGHPSLAHLFDMAETEAKLLATAIESPKGRSRLARKQN